MTNEPVDRLSAAELRDVARSVVMAGINEVRRRLLPAVVEPRVDTVVAGAPKARGSRTEPVDIDMRNWVRKRVAAEAGFEVPIGGEEEFKEHNVSLSSIFGHSDPIDGTTNAETLFSSYAVVVYFDRVETLRPVRMSHLAGAIGAGGGEVTSWCAGPGSGRVVVEWANDMSWGSHSPESAETERPRRMEVTAASLARNEATRVAVNATGETRREMLAKLELRAEELGVDPKEGVWLANTAGNPLIAPLLTGRLGAIYEPKPQRLWDVAYLIPLVLAGGTVRAAPRPGERGPGPDHAIDVLVEFSRPFPDENDDSENREIAPFIASATDDADRLLRRAIKQGARRSQKRRRRRFSRV